MVYMKDYQFYKKIMYYMNDYQSVTNTYDTTSSQTYTVPLHDAPTIWMGLRGQKGHQDGDDRKNIHCFFNEINSHYMLFKMYIADNEQVEKLEGVRQVIKSLSSMKFWFDF